MIFCYHSLNYLRQKESRDSYWREGSVTTEREIRVMWPQVKEWQQSPEFERGKERTPQETSEGIQSCHLDFSPLKLISDLWSPEQDNNSLGFVFILFCLANWRLWFDFCCTIMIRRRVCTAIIALNMTPSSAIYYHCDLGCILYLIFLQNGTKNSSCLKGCEVFILKNFGKISAMVWLCPL